VFGVAPFVCFPNFHHGKTIHASGGFEKDQVSCLSITREYARPHMELRHLRYFIAVAGEENVSRAALKLHVSQPALSRQIRDLEDELGFKLLERSAKSVRLTEAGKTFQGEARAVLQRVEMAMKAARAVATGGRGELHVGYAPSLTARILPPALRAFQSGVPQVRVLLHDLSTEEMLARLRDGGLQIAFLVRPPRAMLRGLQFENLLRESMCLAVAPKHPLARRRTVKLAEFAREPLIAYSRREYPEYHESLSKFFATIRGRPQVAEEHDGITSLIAAVEAGGGVALVSESVACLAGPRLKLIPIAPAPEPLVVGAAWSGTGLAPAAERFLKCAKDTVLKTR
jgi:LysR family transcriptional regulator, benzoate and cis,cis-muconate-responsive activator of ben and cat genes